MKERIDKFTFVFDNKTNNWFIIDTKSDKYKFYARVKRKNNKDWYDDFETKKEKIVNKRTHII